MAFERVKAPNTVIRDYLLLHWAMVVALSCIKEELSQMQGSAPLCTQGASQTCAVLYWMEQKPANPSHLAVAGAWPMRGACAPWLTRRDARV